ncbi:MAG: ABC transporter ATP-binding protein [Lachnospiraceae bacterium]|nr:ABC transporter ATP-binding protein [Lachnospiraceae bacterium]
MKPENAVEVNHVSMCFNLYQQKVDSLKEYVIKAIKGQLYFEEFWALQDVSFEIKRGESVALMGKNGCGKSTMLKTIAGVLKPTKGSVERLSDIAPMIELGVGFDFDLTARENVYLNGALLGYSQEMLDDNFDKIINFAELERFVDVPIKNFSSGMLARLGFAISTVKNAEILIVDEILSVGDYKFQEKCEERIHEMMKNNTTVLFVSHSKDQVKKICNRGILLDSGKVVLDADIDSVCEKYGQE